MNDFSKRITALSPEQRALLELRLKQKKSKLINTSTTTKIPLSAAKNKKNIPASFAQQRMWFQDQLGGKSATSNNIPVTIKINGSLQVSILEKSIREIIQRHESLRTTIKTINKQLIQVISENVSFSLPLIDLRSLTPIERERKAQKLILEEACKPFDLTGNLFLRVKLLRLDETEHLMLITMHHITADAWSIGVFFRELNLLYQAFAKEKSVSSKDETHKPLAKLPIQYADFAVWQRQYIQGKILEQELSYWKQQLQGAPSLLQIATDRTRPPSHSFNGRTQGLVLPKNLTELLKTLSQQTGATLFMTLLAALKTLLYRYTNQEDILVGSPMANRHQPEVEGLIGCFINTIVLRTNLSGNPTFRELLNRVREVSLGAFAHQNLPFEKLVDELQLPRNLSHPPLFQVMFVFQNATSSRSVELPDLKMDYSIVDNHTAQFDITIHLVEEEFGLVGRLEYNTDLFDDSTITRTIEHFQRLLVGIVADPDRRLSELPLLSLEEQCCLLQYWNQTETEYSQNACIQELFEKQVEKTPDVIAVKFQNKQLTYRELNRRVNRLAHYLQKLGVQPEVMVGICVERSLEMVIGILGILKAGGAYVPLDPAYPQERLAATLTNAQVSVLLTQEDLRSRANLPDLKSPVVCLDADWDLIKLESEENLPKRSTPENLAYIIYTSGSTGKPKGVMIQNQSLVNYTEAAIAGYGISNSDRILQFASISFDAAAEEIFPCLTQGATLILRTKEAISSIPEFLKFCHEQQITVLDLPTAFWHQLVTELSATNSNLNLPDSVRLVILGGEKALPERLKTWQKLIPEGVRLVNSYGPTEATIVTTTCDLSEFPLSDNIGKELPIGKPIPNAKTYILDPYLNLTPVGIPGELYIGGVGVARGYLNRPKLTDAAFIQDPFSKKPGARLYKTGDLVRYRTDGNIEFLGRIDNQVKIRGFRIELGEIETLLAQHPQVQTSVVIDREDRPGEKRLVAYLVTVPNPKITNPKGINISELRRFIEQKLPKYMVPEVFVILENLPLNTNGKVDRRALPVPDTNRPELEETFVSPRSSIEQILAEIFSQILEVDQVGIHDDFFELGGNSLLLTQLTSQVLKTFIVDLTVMDLFEAPNIEALAQRIEKIQNRQSLSADLEIKKEREEIEL